MWRDWFNFSRQDRRAILLLAVLLVSVLALLWTRPMWRAEQPYGAHVTDSLLLSLTIHHQEETPIRVVPHPFDPNIADSLEYIP